MKAKSRSLKDKAVRPKPMSPKAGIKKKGYDNGGKITKKKS